MDELIQPQMVIDRYVSGRGITVGDIGVAPTVVISWGYRIVQDLAEEIGARPSENWLYGDLQPFFTGEHHGTAVSLVGMPVGAPGTVMIMEELIACGADTFIGIGWAGSLQAHLTIGSLVIPTSCIREEGTSFHYLEEDVSVSPDDGLVELIELAAEGQGVAVFRGPQWTIDAPYRELKRKIALYRSRGVLGVDMETSAMYALGQYRGVRVCNLLVVSDVLGEEWTEAFGTEEVRRANKNAETLVLECLAGDKLAKPGTA